MGAADPVDDFFASGGKSVPVRPAAPAAPKSTGDPVDDFFASGGKSHGVKPAPKQAPNPLPAPSTEPLPGNTNKTENAPYDTGVLGAAGHLITGAAAQVIGGWRGLATLATGGTMDDAANAVHEAAHKYTYNPEPGSPASKVVDVLESPSDYNPLTIVQRAGKKAGEVAQDVGASPGVSAAIETGVNAVPLVVGARAPVKSAGQAALRLVKPTEALPISRVEPAIRSVPDMADVRAEPLPAQQNIRIADIVEPHPTKLPTDIAPTVELPGKRAPIDPTIDQWPPTANEATRGPLAKTAPLELVPADPVARVHPGAVESPAAPLSLAEDAGRARDRMATSAEAGEEVPKFLEGPPETGAPNGPETAARRGILKRVGVDDVRLSAIAGDAKAAADDFQSAKLNNPYGEHMRRVLDAEKAALENYSTGLVRETGGTTGSSKDVLYSRGNTILTPLEDLNNYFNKEIKSLYTEADKRANGQPVQMPKTHEFVSGDEADFIGTNEGEALLKGVKARMKSLGMVDADGKPQPVTVKQAEQLKQYLGNQWGPRTSRLISGMKAAIDDDVMSAAGADVYAKARAMRAMKGAIFENDMLDPQGRTIPNGIAKIVDANGKNLELLKNTEDIPTVVTTLPADQLGHIVKSLKNLPKDLQPQGAAALAEIKAQFANKIHDIGSSQSGQWAAKNVSQYLKQNAANLQQVFTPDELSKFNDLNDAGHILAKDQSYPGAAVQEHNLVQRGAMKALSGGAAAAGAAVAGPFGAAAAGYVGDMAAKALGEKASLKAAQKRTTRLSDFPGVDK